MTISNNRRIPIDSFSPFPHALEVGVLEIEGRSYTVSLESSEDPFSSKPNSDTIEKIQYLVNLHLMHLKSQGVDLSKIVIQQLDAEGLSYINEDSEQKSLQSSELTFNSSKEDPSYPPSLQNQLISSIADIYKAIMEPLIRKKEEDPSPINTPKSSNRHVIFSPNNKSEEPLTENLDAKSDDLEDLKKKNISPKETVHSDETIEVEAENETTELLSGETKDFSEPEQSGITSKIYNLVSNIWSFLFNPRQKADGNDEPIINTSEIIKKDTSAFLSGFSESQKKDFDRITSIKFTSNLQ